MLLYMTELFEPPVTVGTLIRLFPGVNPDMLHELMVRAERLEALLALVRLDFTPQPSLKLPRVHLHCVLVHEYLEER